MGLWMTAGALVGAIAGASIAGGIAMIVFGMLGAAVGMLIGQSRSVPRANSAPEPGRSVELPVAAASGSSPSPRASLAATDLERVLHRLDAIDARLARIESQLAGERGDASVASAAVEPPVDAHLPGTASPQPPAAARGDTPMRSAAVAHASRQSLPPAMPGERAADTGEPAPDGTVAASSLAMSAVGPARKAGADTAGGLHGGATEQASAPTANAAATPDTAAMRPERVGEPASTDYFATTPGGKDVPPPRPSYEIRSDDAGGGARPEDAAGVPPASDAAIRSPGDSRGDAASPIWRWITGGNALTRIGIVILFFGVAFLLRYFAEIVTVPIELKLAGAAAGGLALAALGLVLAKRRPAYGLSLQGAGAGIVYLTIFAAFRLYDVLPPLPSIALLVVVSATTVATALRHDSQALAGLALAGGFLAPVLIRTGPANPALLFGYFAVLNAAIFALAWKRAWRPLNVLGFVFTFVLGLVWGVRFYTPAHYAIVQPYLVLFFLFYLGIAVLYARSAPLRVTAPVDGVLVFGVPIVGFVLQMAIVRGSRYGVAISAGALALLYGMLWWTFARSAQSGLALLARAFAALSIIFATLAVPFAVDPRETSAWWALEAAGVYALGVMQRQPLARMFAVLLQLAAAVAFALDRPASGGMLLLNASFLGAALIGASALASVWFADRYLDRLSGGERSLLPWMFAWGGAWWLAGGALELRRIPHPGYYDALLAWFAGTAAAALAWKSRLAWPRIAWLAAPLPLAMGAVAVADIASERTTLGHYGWFAWPFAWVVVWLALRAHERRTGTQPATAQASAVGIGDAHALAAIALVGWMSWELAYWTSELAPPGTAWDACAAVVPSLALLFAVVRLRDSGRWPLSTHVAAYGVTAGSVVAALAFAWIVVVNLASAGDPAPLPYLPLLNPIDVATILALGTLASWDAAFTRHAARVRYGALGTAAFLALNGTVARTAHHWGDVPWTFDALVAYKPLQAALTLTWTVTALAVMVYATRRGIRALWIVGAALLGVVVVKLFVVDLPALSGLTRVIAFMGVGLLLLVIGYVTPFPPAVPEPGEPAANRTGGA